MLYWQLTPVALCAHDLEGYKQPAKRQWQQGANLEQLTADFYAGCLESVKVACLSLGLCQDSESPS